MPETPPLKKKEAKTEEAQHHTQRARHRIEAQGEEGEGKARTQANAAAGTHPGTRAGKSDQTGGARQHTKTSKAMQRQPHLREDRGARGALQQAADYTTDWLKEGSGVYDRVTTFAEYATVIPSRTHRIPSELRS